MQDNRTIVECIERLQELLLTGDRADAHGIGATKIDITGETVPENFGKTTQASSLERHIERAGSSKTDEPSALEEIVNRIHSSAGRAHIIADNLEEIGTRVMGPLPQDDSQMVEKSKPDGTLDLVFKAFSGLDDALTRLHRAAERLERV